MPPLVLKDLVLQTLTKIAPDADLIQLQPEIRFRDQFDFDSVDLINFIEKLQDAVQYKIPETDYPQMTSLKGCIAYLENLVNRPTAGE